MIFTQNYLVYVLASIFIIFTSHIECKLQRTGTLPTVIGILSLVPRKQPGTQDTFVE